MSSHHFVKEGQEPALFIVDAFSLIHIEPLLEWAPLVMVLDTCLDVALSWGIKIDIVLVEAGNIELTREKIKAQIPVLILPYMPGQVPLFIGLGILSAQQKAVHIISTVTEAVFACAEAFTEKINIVLLDDEIKWSYITSGEFEKWLPACTKLLLRKRNAKHPFYFHGLNITADNKVESSADGKITITSESSFWIGETIV